MSYSPEAFIPKSLFSALPKESVIALLRNSKIDQYEADEEVRKPKPGEELLFVAEGEVSLCDIRNPRIDIQNLTMGKSIELNKYFAQGEWQFYWKARNSVKILRCPWAAIVELLKANQVYGNYLARISAAPEIQKFNRILRQFGIPAESRIAFISSLQRGNFQQVFADWNDRKFVIVSSGRLRLNCYLNAGKNSILELQGGDDILIDLRSENVSLELITPGDAWFVHEKSWLQLKDHSSMIDFLSLYEKKHTRRPMQIKDNFGPTQNATSIPLPKKEKPKVSLDINSAVLFAGSMILITSALAMGLSFISSLVNRITFDKVLVNKDGQLALIVVLASGILSLATESIQNNVTKVTEYLAKSHNLKKVSSFLNQLVGTASQYFEYTKESELIEQYESYTEFLQTQVRVKFEFLKWILGYAIASFLFYFLSPKLSWVIIVSVLWLIAFSLISEKILEHIKWKKEEAKKDHYENAYDLTSLMPSYKALNLWAVVRSHFSKTLSRLDFLTYVETVAKSIETQALEFLIEFYKLVILFFAVLLFTRGQITVGLVISLPVILGTFLGQLRKFHMVTQMYARLISLGKTSISPQQIPKGVDRFPAPAGQKNCLEIQGLNFSYQKSKGIFSLSNINLSIEEGEKVIVLGPSGSGKSTLLGLLAGSISTSVPIRKSVEIENQILMPQNGILFSGTLQQNLTGFIENIEFEQVQKTCAELDLTTLIERLPNNFQTNIQAQGAQFSEGQKQRIQLARLFFKNYKLCFLDEATSLLDPVSEQRILAQIFQRYQSQTILFATQRSHIVPYFNKIIFMVDGQIAEMGSHAELIKARGPYFDYFCAQVRN